MAEQNSILPLPSMVLKHHGGTIFAPMKEWISQEHPPPVLLLTGMQGIGKRNVAYFLAQWLFCQKTAFSKNRSGLDSEAESFFGSMFSAPSSELGSPSTSDPTQPCGTCTACQHAIHGNWVDFKEIVPEPNSNNLKIDQFRELKSTLGFGAHEAPFRITLIPNADRMTVQAANSLLKILEEPPPGWIFLLTASDATLILPTVLSRCQMLRLKPFDRETVEQLLIEQGIERNRASICSRLAHGSWHKALSLSGDELWDKRRILFSFIKTPSEQINPLVDWAALELENFTLLVDQLESILHDLIGWSLNPEIYQWANIDGKESLSFHTTQGRKAFASIEALRTFWLERAERLAQSRQEVLTPVNRKLLLQDLLLPWLKLQKTKV